MISEQPKRKWKTVGTVYSEDHTPVYETHARSSGSPQYAAAVLPTVDQNQKKFLKKCTTIGDFMKTRCHK
jgi:hypothetical protein